MREFKEEIQNNAAILHRKCARTNFETRLEGDSDISLIRQLREIGKKWGTIANILSQIHDEDSSTEAWTPTRVYSHLISSMTATASRAREVGFDTRDYAHLHNPGDAVERSTAGRKRVKNSTNATELAANVRDAGILEQQREELLTPEVTQQLMSAVAVVDRNFWSLVADELERRTARYYAPHELAEQFHEI